VPADHDRPLLVGLVEAADDARFEALPYSATSRLSPMPPSTATNVCAPRLTVVTR